MAGFAQAIFRGAVAAATCDWRPRQSPGECHALMPDNRGESSWRGAANSTRGACLPEAAVLEQMLISGFRVRCDSRLERNTMIGPGRFRRCAGADLFRPFGVLVVWVLI